MKSSLILNVILFGLNDDKSSFTWHRLILSILTGYYWNNAVYPRHSVIRASFILV